MISYVTYQLKCARFG